MESKSYIKLTELILIIIFLINCSSPQTSNVTNINFSDDIVVESPFPFKSGVVASETYIKSHPQGYKIGYISAGVIVKILEHDDEYTKVVTQSPFKIEGWIKSNSLGFVVKSQTFLFGDEKKGSQLAELLPGALLLWRGVQDENLYKVVTNSPFKISGFIEKQYCSIGEDGNLYEEEYKIKSNEKLYEIKNNVYLRGNDLTTPFGQIDRGNIFIGLKTERNWINGFVKQPVIIKGWIPAYEVKEWQMPSPLDILGKNLEYTHEVIINSPLYLNPHESENNKLTILNSGTNLISIKRQNKWVQVETLNKIQIRGWIKEENIQEVTLSNNADLIPLYTRPEHDPVERSPIF